MDTVISIPYLGVPKTSQKIVPGDTMQRISPNVVVYKQYTVAYTSGGTTEIKANDTIVGATSGVAADVVSITLTSGTWAGGDAAGVITLCNVHHPTAYATAWTANEKLKVRGGTDDATMTDSPVADTSDYAYKGATAKAIIVQAIAQNALISIDGSNPNQTYVKGITVPANTSITITGPEAIRNLKVLDRVSGSASIVNIQGFFHGPWGIAE